MLENKIMLMTVREILDEKRKKYQKEFYTSIDKRDSLLIDIAFAKINVVFEIMEMIDNFIINGGLTNE